MSGTPMRGLRALGAAIRAGELSPTEHVANVLDRLAADPHHVVITLDAERALAQAAALTAELADGRYRGPLHGVALGVKDLIDVAGLPTRAGSVVLADAPPATADAPVVAALRAAGAIVVAKLHTHEFAYGPTGDVAATGPAHNPHDPSRITGGSSSGSAAAVAAGHLALALGTDTGASVRTPAALCGVVGLKPAFGRLPTTGVFPLSETCDHVGLLTPDVDSAALAWDALAPPASPNPRPDLLSAGAVRAACTGLRVGTLGDAYWQAADPTLNAAAAGAADALAAAGAQVVELRTPMIDELAACYPEIVGAEAYATHARWLAERPQDYQPPTRDRLLPFAEQPAHRYVAALRDRRRLVDELRAAVRGVDVLVLPTTRLRATPIGAGEVQVGGATVPVRSSMLALTLPFNLTGWPAVSVPGRIAPDAPDPGLPAGVQLVGVTRDGPGLLAVAAALAGA
jgi:aspartyl-tRNA(Asn)/glutamyl-tRNA(Gln) amidotransferase subunit A